MNKSEFLSLLATKYVKVGTEEVIEAEDSQGITRYLVNVLEEGFSDNQEPEFYRRNIRFYVVDEGDAEEVAGFEQKVPRKHPGNGTTSSGTLESIANIYNSESIQIRMSSAIIKTAQAVFFESTSVTNHAERLEMALSALVNKGKYLFAFMSMAALNVTIQGNGSDSTDAQLEAIVSSWWTNFALNEFGD